MLKLDEPPQKFNLTKEYIEELLSEISNSERDLFSYIEVENMLLDIYNFVLLETK